VLLSIAPGTSSMKPLSISSMIAIETVSAASAIGRRQTHR
jgi:hypothetical protein